MPRGKTQKRNTPEFKKEVIETMLVEKLGQYRTNELVRWRMHFSSHAIANFEVLIYGRSKNLQAADGEKGIANAADELCGIALAFLCEWFQSPSS